MSNEIKVVNRYFKTTFVGDTGATVWINDGIPIKNEITGEIKRVNPKSVKVDSNGILTTNDAETIYAIYNTPIIKRMFTDIKTGKINELFVNKSEDSLLFAKKYNVDIDNHIETVKAQIEAGYFKHTPKVKRDTEIAIAKAESDDIELEKIKIQNEMDKIEIEEKKQKIEAVKKSKKQQQ